MLGKCNRIWKRAVALSVCLSMLIALVSCNFSDLKNKLWDKDTADEEIKETPDTENGKQPESPDDNKDSADKEENEENEEAEDDTGDICFPVDPPYNFFSKCICNSRVLLKLKPVKLHDNTFWNPDGLTGRYYMLECEMIEDLYGKIETTNEIVAIPIITRYDITFQDVKDLLSTLDCFYMQLHLGDDELCFIEEADDGIELSTSLSIASFGKYSFYPVVDGKVSFRLLNDFYEENNAPVISDSSLDSVKDYCYDGIPCEDFEKNIRELPYQHKYD